MIENPVRDISEPNDDLTSITFNDYSASVVSIIDDDVDSMNGAKIIKPDKPNYVFDVDNYLDNSERDVDKYDLEKLEYNNWREKSTDDEDDDAVTVVAAPVASNVRVTRHETKLLNEYGKTFKPDNDYHMNENDARSVSSTSSFEIGRQISQLAKRIESLGNISKLYNDENKPYEFINPVKFCHHPPKSQSCDCNHGVQMVRDIEGMERLQKRQESMQVRLMELATKLNDTLQQSQKEAAIEPDEYKENKANSPKRKSNRKNGKSRKTKNAAETKSNTSSFMNEILNQLGPSPVNGGDNLTPRDSDLNGEQQLRGSNYYLPVGGNDNSSTSTATRYFNQELDGIRHEFRNQVQEIRHLLSERYQQEPVRSCSPHRVHSPTRREHVCPGEHCVECARPCSPLRPICTNTIPMNHCPVDKYMKIHAPTAAMNLPSLDDLDPEFTPSLRPGILPSVARAIRTKQRLISDPVEAEKFLMELNSRRSNLENNIRAIERTKQSEFMFGLLKKLQGNEDSIEKARIQAMVDDCINSTNPDVQTQVQKEHKNWLIKREELRQQESDEARKAELEAKQQARSICINAKSAATAFKPKPISTKYKTTVTTDKTTSIKQTPYGPVCKKYEKVQSRIDSGLNKPNQPIYKTTSTSLVNVNTASKSNGYAADKQHPQWANRRRNRQPYLHFMNELKLAKKPIVPLGELSSHQYSPNTGRKNMSKTTSQTTRYSSYADDDICPFGYRQYSLDYEPPIISPKTSNSNSSLDDKSKSNSIASGNDKSRSNKLETSDFGVQVSFMVPGTGTTQRDGSPTFSEFGTGVKYNSKGDRQAPVQYRDPLDKPAVIKPRINVTRFVSPTSEQPQDELHLRRLIEEALLLELGDDTPHQSVDLSVDDRSISINNNYISTPRHSFTDKQLSRRSTQEQDLTLPYDPNEPGTPDATLQYSISRSKISTPTSPTRKSRSETFNASITKQPLIPVSTQTVENQASQTCDNRACQTTPFPTPTQTPRKQQSQNLRDQDDESELAQTSEYVDSITSTVDTVPDTFSDGMWMMDRSLGECAPHPIDPNVRWGLGAAPDIPRWPTGTQNILDRSGSTSPSDGQFIRPTVPGLIPTQDPVLQAIQICKHADGTPVLVRAPEYYEDDDQSFEYIDQYRKKPDKNRNRMDFPGAVHSTPRSTHGHSESDEGEIVTNRNDNLDTDEQGIVPLNLSRVKDSTDSSVSNRPTSANNKKLTKTQSPKSTISSPKSQGHPNQLRDSAPMASSHPVSHHQSNDSIPYEVASPSVTRQSNDSYPVSGVSNRGSLLMSHGQQSDYDEQDDNKLISTGQLLQYAYAGSANSLTGTMSDFGPGGTVSHDNRQPGRFNQPSKVNLSRDTIPEDEYDVDYEYKDEKFEDDDDEDDISEIIAS